MKIESLILIYCASRKTNLVPRHGIRYAAIVRTFRQTSDDCGYVATWLRAAAKNTDRNGTDITTAVCERDKVLYYDTEARWHFLTKTVVEQYAGKVVKPPGTTKANRIKQLEKSDRGWALRKAGPERGMKVASARNPRLGTYICYGVKTVTTDKISARDGCSTSLGILS